MINWFVKNCNNPKLFITENGRYEEPFEDRSKDLKRKYHRVSTKMFVFQQLLCMLNVTNLMAVIVLDRVKIFTPLHFIFVLRDRTSYRNVFLNFFFLSYLQGILTQLDKALKNKVNIIGYGVWSFMDSLEWSIGYFQ